MILIIIIIIKITSPTDASSEFHFTEVKMKRKKKGLCQRCELSSGLGSTMMEAWRTGREKKGWGGLHLFSHQHQSEPSWSRGPPCPPPPSRSVALARLAAHLSEVGAAAELELEHQRAVGHLVHVFAF